MHWKPEELLYLEERWGDGAPESTVKQAVHLSRTRTAVKKRFGYSRRSLEVQNERTRI